MSDVLADVAVAPVALWGVAHVIPTPRVIAGFEPITPDDGRVTLQEWIVDAFTM
jgi:hypothetical protein